MWYITNNSQVTLQTMLCQHIISLGWNSLHIRFSLHTSCSWNSGWKRYLFNPEAAHVSRTDLCCHCGYYSFKILPDSSVCSLMWVRKLCQCDHRAQSTLQTHFTFVALERYAKDQKCVRLHAAHVIPKTKARSTSSAHDDWGRPPQLSTSNYLKSFWNLCPFETRQKPTQKSLSSCQQCVFLVEVEF